MVSLDKVSVDDKWFQFLENQQEDFVGITDSFPKIIIFRLIIFH